ncbi:MAG: phosphoglycerate kinase [Patescibacteria group bacterium]
MHYIDEAHLQNKRVLLRVDFNVPINKQLEVINDERIRQSIPTIKYLLSNNNLPVLLAHLGQPKGIDKALSLEPIAKRLQELLPDVKVMFVPDLQSVPRENTRKGITKVIVLLENIRFFAGETNNDPAFTKQLAGLGDVYINDAFSVSHRKEASIIGLPTLLPAFGGLLMKKEIEMVHKLLDNPAHPFVAILGGAKISTKISFLNKLIEIADTILLGGGLANTFLLAENKQVGESLAEADEINAASELLALAKEKGKQLLLPTDVLIGEKDAKQSLTKVINELSSKDTIFDIGPQTVILYTEVIAQAKTLLWNGPLGYFENPAFAQGTDGIFQALVNNTGAISVIGGGETITSIADETDRNKITHISTGGGALLDYIANGTLPGIEALNTSELS